MSAHLPLNPEWLAASVSVRRSILPSPYGSGLGLWSFRLSRSPLRSLSLRPDDSLTIPWMAWSVGFRNSVSFLPATQATRRLTLASVGLWPTERASLRWTHFRTSGFPQYGFKRGVGCDLRPRTYTHPKPTVLISMAANGMDDEISRSGIPVQRPLARQGVMLSPRVVAYYGLIRTSRGLPSTYGFVDRSLPLPVARGSPIYSACPFHRAAPWTPTDRAVARGCHFTARSGLRRLRSGSASAIPRAPVRARRVTRLMGSHSLRPDGLLALHRPRRLHSSFHLLSCLSKTSNMTTRVDSQFPRPVFHRRDTQPYGLRTKITKKRKRFSSCSFVSFVPSWSR